MSSFSTRWATWGFALVSLSACRATIVADDPYRDAVHMGTVGHSGSFGRNTEAPSKPTPPARSYAEEVEHLDRLLERWWIHQPSPRPPFTPFGDQPPPGDRETYSRALRAALCGLGDANLRVHPGPSSMHVTSGVQFAWAGSELVLAAADRTYEDLEASPKPGDIVERINDQTIQTWDASRCIAAASSAAHRQALLARALSEQTPREGEDTLPRTLTLRNARGKSYTLKLQWNQSSQNDAKCVEARAVEPTIAVLRITDFDCAGVDGRPSPTRFEQQLGQALESLGDAKEIVLDLRDARGHATEAAQHLAQRLVPEAETWSRHRVIDPGHADHGFKDKPLPPSSAKPLEGRLWALTGPGCTGTCEVLVAFLTQDPSVLRLGRTTAGAVGKPKTFKLPFSHLDVDIPTETFAIPGTDVSLEGIGVNPDVEILVTAEDLREGRDPALDSIRQRTQDSAALPAPP